MEVNGDLVAEGETGKVGVRLPGMGGLFGWAANFMALGFCCLLWYGSLDRLSLMVITARL